MSNNYCFTLTDKFSISELVGQKALDFAKLGQNNINTPAGFVLTGYAFDDFLVDNNLVGFIVDRLTEITTNPNQLPNYAAEIRDRILQGQISDDITQSILSYYQKLSPGNDAFVSMKPSALNHDLDQTTFLGSENDYHNIRGSEGVLSTVKQMWAELFMDEAVKYRIDIDYEGNLSQPIIVQKMLNSEISGDLFNFDSNTGTENQITITANLGIRKENKFDDESDFYLLDKISGKLLKRDNNTQKFMYVKSLNTSGGELTQVKVSKAWSEKIKLDDIQLQKLFSTTNLIEKTWQGKWRASWIYESGNFHITEMDSIPEEKVLGLTKIPWKEASTKSEQKSTPEPEPVDIPKVPVSTTPQVKELDRDEMVEFLKENKNEFVLTDAERESKAETVKEMVSEIKTVTEVWWDVRKPATEVKVFKNNIDGFGIFTIKEIVKTLAMDKELENLKDSHNLQKQICEYLAIYLVAASPKPIFIQLDRDLEFEDQVDIFSQLKNLYGHKNFWCILPEIREVKEISYYKQVLTSNGFRRTNVFKIFQLINQPLFLANLPVILDQGIDGIILDVDTLNTHALGGLEQQPDGNNFELLMNLITENLVDKSQTRLFTYLLARSEKLLDKMLVEMLDNGVNGIVYTHDDLFDFKQELAEKESSALTKSLKRMKTRMAPPVKKKDKSLRKKRKTTTKK